MRQLKKVLESFYESLFFLQALLFLLLFVVHCADPNCSPLLRVLNVFLGFSKFHLIHAFGKLERAKTFVATGHSRT